MRDWSPRSGALPPHLGDPGAAATAPTVRLPRPEHPFAGSPPTPARRSAHRTPRRRLLRRIVRFVLVIVVLGLVGGVALAVSTPGVGDAEQRATAITASHHAAGPDTPVPDRFTAALLATEDSRFYSHPGIDVIGVARGAVVALTSGGDPGGATIDQQLAKQLYSGGQEGGPVVKAEQATLAVKLDATYTKQQILGMYAAVVYFGHGFYGLTAASEGYFGVPPEQLSWGQAALLAGLVQAPSSYDPVNHLDLATARRQHVLNRLVATGHLSAQEAAAAAAAPLRLVGGR